MQPSVNKVQRVYGKWKEHVKQAGVSKQKSPIIKQPKLLADCRFTLFNLQAPVSFQFSLLNENV